MHSRHRIQFPAHDMAQAGQDEAYFYLAEGANKRRIRIQDYREIYSIPGLYEQIVYERLRCQSPAKVAATLQTALSQSRDEFSALRVLDFGAGNGKMGEALNEYGVSRLIGVDIIGEARAATERDRPGLYDEYYVTDFSTLDDEMRAELASWSFDCLTTVSALSFGEIPPQAFIEAIRLIRVNGWVAFNIKETFLDNSDQSGFSIMIRELIFSEYLDLYSLERYRHRVSIEGKPLYYFAIVARKSADIPADFLQSVGITQD